MKIETELRAGDAKLRVHGVLDPAYVRALRVEMDELSRVAGRIVIDLGDARDVQHHALAMLAEDVVQRRRPSVVLQGLCRHHLRMLRYFGLEPAARGMESEVAHADA